MHIECAMCFPLGKMPGMPPGWQSSAAQCLKARPAGAVDVHKDLIPEPFHRVSRAPHLVLILDVHRGVLCPAVDAFVRACLKAGINLLRVKPVLVADVLRGVVKLLSDGVGELCHLGLRQAVIHG